MKAPRNHNHLPQSPPLDVRSQMRPSEMELEEDPTSGGHFVKSHGPSPSPPIYLFFPPPAPLLSYWLASGRSSVFAHGTEGQKLQRRLNCVFRSNKLCQKLCVGVFIVMFLYSGCHWRRLGSCTLSFITPPQPLKQEHDSSWQTVLLRKEQKCRELNKPVVKEGSSCSLVISVD